MEIDVKLKPTQENMDWFESMIESSNQSLEKESETARALLAKTKDSVLANFLKGYLNELEVK